MPPCLRGILTHYPSIVATLFLSAPSKCGSLFVQTFLFEVFLRVGLACGDLDIELPKSALAETSPTDDTHFEIETIRSVNT